MGDAYLRNIDKLFIDDPHFWLNDSVHIMPVSYYLIRNGIRTWLTLLVLGYLI